MTRRPILVTGGSGFIGRHLVAALLQRGEQVTLLTRPRSTLDAALAAQVTRIDCADWLSGCPSQGKPDPLTDALAGHDFALAYHLASYGVAPGDRDIDLITRFNANVGAKLVALAGERCAGVVLAGSVSEYAAPHEQTPINEQAPLEQTKLYGASKAAGTLLASAVAASTATPLACLRLFNIYGPGEAAHRLLPSLLRDLEQGNAVALSPGAQIRDFLYVKDAVAALIAAGSKIVASPGSATSLIRTYNICTGQGSSVRTFAEQLCDVAGANRDLLNFGALPLRPDDVPWIVGDASLAAEELTWRHRYDLATGLADAVRTIRDQTEV